MNDSYFYMQELISNNNNNQLLKNLQAFSSRNKQQMYIINSPLAADKYNYNYKDCIIILSPGFKIIFIDLGQDPDRFEEFYNDFIEDLGAISDKYNYKECIGRPKIWKTTLTTKIDDLTKLSNLDLFFSQMRIEEGKQKKHTELLISLLTGSINDIIRVGSELPDHLLDKVKQKIVLFDGDQTRFVYKNFDKKVIKIQGLSGTGKTELLLHKLKEIYLNKDLPNSKVIFTCHNKILANNMFKRIPDFFDFMKVEQQILWNTRLWCVGAWGSKNDPNSGAYRYICDFYDIVPERYNSSMPFSKACNIAIQELTSKNGNLDKYAFDYMLIDESQDFPPEFISLCELVTSKTVYVAGDIFQNIFTPNFETDTQVDFTLSKCYRTDPKTLMFAHGLGMGLFEDTPLAWLTENELELCGYQVKKNTSTLCLSREPIRRFDDVEDSNLDSIEIITTENLSSNSYTLIIDILKKIISENPTITPNDIGIVMIEDRSFTYDLATRLKIAIIEELSWKVNIAYDSKEKLPDSLFISNQNNVKGLEFPFIICITNEITNKQQYRNTLYMLMTRSFIKTYLVLNEKENGLIIEKSKKALEEILDSGKMTIRIPPPEKITEIRKVISSDKIEKSQNDIINDLIIEFKLPREIQNKVIEITRIIISTRNFYDKEEIRKTMLATIEQLNAV